MGPVGNRSHGQNRGVNAPAYSLRLSALPAQNQRPISVKSAVQNGLVSGRRSPTRSPSCPSWFQSLAPSEEADKSVRAPLRSPEATPRSGE